MGALLLRALTTPYMASFLLTVRHELTHFQRRDLAGRALLFLAFALYWFDPLVWYMARVDGRTLSGNAPVSVEYR